jgi:uncharacterized membrane protein YagU involved in acid resistance
MQPGITRVFAAGVLGTLVMTAVGVFVAPLVGMPPMNPADMLASQMGGVSALGWAGHLMIGIVLALIYAKLVFGRLPGPGVLQGTLYSIAPWLMAQLIVMPMMGMPVFSGSPRMAVGSLVGHLMYGAVLGITVGNVTVRAPTFREVHA